MELIFFLLIIVIAIFVFKNNNSFSLPQESYKKTEPEYIKIEKNNLIRYKEFFDNLFEYSLTQDQRKSIVCDADDISEKYILQNSTTNYAVLYIASEKLIDLVDKIEDLRQECLTDKKILIQGPNTLAAFLDTIRVGHHYLKLNKTAEKVAKVVSKINKEFSNFNFSTNSTLRKLDGAVNEIQKLQTRLNVLGRTLEKGAENLEEFEKDE